MDFAPVIKALADRGSPELLVALLFIGMLFYLLREERAARKDDAKMMIEAVSKVAASMDKISDVVTELRIAVAARGRSDA